MSHISSKTQSMTQFSGATRRMTVDDIANAAESIGCEVAALRAVIEVESRHIQRRRRSRKSIRTGMISGAFIMTFSRGRDSGGLVLNFSQRDKKHARRKKRPSYGFGAPMDRATICRFDS
jgi:hypothetical protein